MIVVMWNKLRVDDGTGKKWFMEDAETRINKEVFAIYIIKYYHLPFLKFSCIPLTIQTQQAAGQPLENDF